MSENTDSIKVFEFIVDDEKIIVAAYSLDNAYELLLKDDFICDPADKQFEKEIPIQSWYDTFIIVNEDDEISLAFLMKDCIEPYIIATTIF